VREYTDTNNDKHNLTPQRDTHDWYYISEQSPDDILIFKSYDNNEPAPAPLGLRADFRLPGANDPRREQHRVRETVEARALVFTCPEGVARPPTNLRRHRDFEQMGDIHREILLEASKRWHLANNHP